MATKKSTKNELNQLKVIPLIGLREGVIYPQTEAVLTFGRSVSISAVVEAFNLHQDVCFVSQKDSKKDNPNPEDYYDIGTLCQVVKTLPINDELHAIVRGINRVKIDRVEVFQGKLLAAVTDMSDGYINTPELSALMNHVVSLVKKAIDLGKPNVDPQVFSKIANTSDPIGMSYQIASVLNLKNQERQELLQEDSLDKRFIKLGDYLAEEVKVLELEKKIENKTQKKFDESMKEAVLRERMRTIQKELGESDDDNDIRELRKKVKEAKLPKIVLQKTIKELDRLAKLSFNHPETGYIRTWIETVVEIPWSKESKSNYDIQKASKILDQDHYGLEKVKERIIEYISVLKLKSEKINKTKKDKKQSVNIPTILCFVGPPGVGKTSVGRSIAKALGREFTKVSLGGIRDEAEIRGHRRTYVGALPGRVIQSIKDVGVKNPVFMLDEIDKIGTDFRGDPTSALLEVLDPEQNYAFHDHYLDMPYDLSQVLFITTANVMDTIPPALRDRLEVIEFSGYTEEEKFFIAKKYLISKQLEHNALDPQDLNLSDTMLKELIKNYTREAGVRNLERQVSAICRKTAKIKASNKKNIPVVITNQKLVKFLGPAHYNRSQIESKAQVGIVTGMAYTQAGGDILFIEVATMPGKGNITLTGHLGQVMKESARAAYSYVRSHYQLLAIDPKKLNNSDLHIHVPEGAVPKDGPSAGLAITTALISAFSNRPIPHDLAMTGEVTLRGRALEIGGVKEKVIAAHRAGIKQIIMPEANKKNLIDLPAKVKKDLKFHFVKSMDDVVKVVFASKQGR